MAGPGEGSDTRVGLCASCAHANVITTRRGSVFYLCRLSFSDPAFARYPALPVLACAGHRPGDSGTPEDLQ